MEYESLCGTFQELYGKNNDHGLFRKMDDVETFNMMRNFEGGAFFDLKGLNPFNKYDFYTTSSKATENILKALKPWDELTPPQQKFVLDYCTRQHQKEGDENHLSADMVLFYGFKNKSFIDKATALSDDGLPIQLEMTEKGARVYKATYGKQALASVIKEFSQSGNVTASEQQSPTKELMKEEPALQSGIVRGLAQAERGDVQVTGAVGSVQAETAAARTELGQPVNTQEAEETGLSATSRLGRY